MRTWTMFIVILFIASSVNIFLTYESKANEENHGTPEDYTIHEPIVINGDSNFTKENGVVSGNGTYANPYIIEGWEINGEGTSMSCISIFNTKSYFVIRNCLLYGSYISGIRLSHVENGTIEQSICKSYNCHLISPIIYIVENQYRVYKTFGSVFQFLHYLSSH